MYLQPTWLGRTRFGANPHWDLVGLLFLGSHLFSLLYTKTLQVTW
jgi:hypothetical protein